MTGTCSVDGCDRPSKCRGLCQAHYFRLRRNGDVGPASISGRQRHFCSVDGCDRRVSGQGLCWTHLRRLRKGGSVDYRPEPRRGPATHAWRGDAVTYKDMHARVVRARGRASEHACVDCGKPARHWSYDHADPAEKSAPKGWAYSLDVAHYEPRCVPCHKRFDLEVSA
jgi:hypothetical protein